MENIKIFIDLIGKFDSKLLAKARVDFPVYQDSGYQEDAVIISISGFMVMEDKYSPHSYRVIPPSIRTSNGYKRVFFLTPEGKWRELEESIIEEYLKLKKIIK